MIVLSNLTTGYSKNSPLLQNFNYCFENKIYGVLGESGCGKTTLLRTIAGLTKPLSGEIFIDGKAIKRANENDVYMMHQNYTSFDWMNTLQNVLITKRIKGIVTAEDKERAIQMLTMVGLQDHIDKFPRQLSGGMRQRLALARTLFMKPKIILMDEPLSALDGTTRAKMQDVILSLHKETNNTIIMITHSKEEAKRMCNKIINMEEI